MTHVNRLLTLILVKIAIFVILANFELIFRGEELQIAKKSEDMLKIVVLASYKSKQNCKKSSGTLWD